MFVKSCNSGHDLEVLCTTVDTAKLGILLYGTKMALFGVIYWGGGGMGPQLECTKSYTNPSLGVSSFEGECYMYKKLIVGGVNRPCNSILVKMTF